MHTTTGPSVTAPFDSDDTIPIVPQASRPPSAARPTPRRVTVSIFFPLLVWAFHFIAVNLTAVLAYRYGTSTTSSPPFKPTLGEPAPIAGVMGNLVEPMRHWDGLWYALVSERGYGFHDANAAFWPAFPLSMRYVGDITGLDVQVAGFLIANISFAVALILLYSLIAIDCGATIARRAIWLLAIFPTALFFSAVYTESTFLMLSVGALLFARINRWWIAGILGLLAALTRSYGVFLILPMTVLALQEYGFYLRALVPRAIPIGLPALGPVLFGLHLERVQGSWKQFIDVQSMWNRTFAWPWETMKCAVDGCTLTLTQYGNTSDKIVEGADWSWLDQLVRNPRWSLVTNESLRKTAADSDTLELVLTLLFVGLAILGLKLLPLYQTVYLVPGLIIPLFSPSTVHPLMSMPRFGLTYFPLFVVLAIVLKWRIVRLPYTIVSLLLLVILTAQFANWYWVS